MEYQSQLQPQFLANDTSVKKYNLTLEKYCLDNEEDYQDFKKLMIYFILNKVFFKFLKDKKKLLIL